MLITAKAASASPYGSNRYGNTLDVCRTLGINIDYNYNYNTGGTVCHANYKIKYQQHFNHIVFHLTATTSTSESTTTTIMTTTCHNQNKPH